MKNKKAQIMMTDLFVALSVFLVLLISVVSFMILYEKRVNSNMAYEDMRMKAMQIANFLVKSPGIPQDWENNASSVMAIGLASAPLILSEEKVVNFTTLDYERAKTIFNVRHYEFNFVLMDSNNSILFSKGIESANESVSISRYVRFNNSNSLMIFRIYKH